MKSNFGILGRSERIVLFLFLAVVGLVVWAPAADASPSYFTSNCAGCHVGQTGTNYCGMCHAHGVHASSSKTDFNVAGTLNKATFAPGEMVSVTISGGYRPSQARAVLYDQNGVQLAISTGTPSSGGGPVNAPVWPVTLKAPAPSTAATYTWKIAWYGNQYDTGSYGPGWKADTGNSGHGWEIVSLPSFKVAAASDTTAPTVGSTAPVNGATAVPVASSVTATFSEAVDPLTVSTANFLLKQGTTGVPGTVTLSGTTATFKPSASLAAATAYTATVTTGVKDIAGNSLAANYTWSFTTAAAVDTTPPTVSSVTPVANATGVAVNTSVTATFSESVDPLTVTSSTFTLKNGSTTVPASVSVSGATATLKPSAALTAGATYTAAISTGVKDPSGNALASAYTWTFGTSSAPDTTPPTVTSTSPAKDATAVQVSTAVTATFSEKLDASSVTTAAFSLKTGTSAPIGGAVTYVGTTATFAPTSPLAPNTTYTATLSNAIKDLAGNGLAQPYTWSFTTASQTSGNDRDGDGVGDDDDDYPDNDKIATVHEPKGHGKIKIDVSQTGGAYLRSVMAIADSDPSLNQSHKPAGYEFKYGMVEYEAHGIGAGGSVQVRLTYPDAIPSGSKVYQADSSGFHEMTGATINGNVVTMTLTDGGVGDRDMTRNAVIADPVGVATPAAEPAAAGGGGCSMTGTGGSSDLPGAFGVVALAALVIALRGRRKGKAQ